MDISQCPRRRSHVTLTVTFARILVLLSFPRIFEEKRDCSQSIILCAERAIPNANYSPFFCTRLATKIRIHDHTLPPCFFFVSTARRCRHSLDIQDNNLQFVTKKGVTAECTASLYHRINSTVYFFRAPSHPTSERMFFFFNTRRSFNACR